MGTLRMLREAQEEIYEKDLQRAIEADLTVLEEGLQKVDTEVSIGTEVGSTPWL